MKCPKCGSENVNVQAVSIVKIQNGKGLIWWICIGWWWMMIKFVGWILFGLLMLIPKLFSRKKTKIKTVVKSMAVCQNCGHKWKV